MLLLYVALLLGFLAPTNHAAPSEALHLRCQDDAEDLAEARSLLLASREGDCRKGAEICVRLNSVASTKLLLKVLGLTSSRGLAAAHFRDVCWVALRRIKDPDAQMSVADELHSNKKNEHVRQWCAELLGLYENPDAEKDLIRALDDKFEDVRAAAARALGRLRCEGAQKALLKRTKSKNPITRANAIEALVLIDAETHWLVFLKGIKDKDAGVRCALYATGHESYPEQAEELAVQALADEDWRPRLQGVENLTRIKTKSSVDALIDALGDARPVVAVGAVTGLQKLTREGFARKENWDRWWKDEREAFDFPEGRRKPIRKGESTSIVEFNGIKLESSHTAFLLDKSSAMDGWLESKGMSKDEAAHAELEGVLNSLQGDLIFNLFCYERSVSAFNEKGAVKLTKSSAKKALKFHRSTSMRGNKDIWQALLAVLEDTQLDTAYLLSSGEPDVGLYVHYERISYQLKELNRFHKVVFHSIAYSDSEYHRDQLEHIALATGGSFKWFD